MPFHGTTSPREKSGMIPWRLIRGMVVGFCIASAVRAEFKEVARRYFVKGDGTVSRVVADAKGKVWRTLLSVEPREAGDHVESWDKLDR